MLFKTTYLTLKLEIASFQVVNLVSNFLCIQF